MALGGQDYHSLNLPVTPSTNVFFSRYGVFRLTLLTADHRACMYDLMLAYTFKLIAIKMYSIFCFKLISLKVNIFSREWEASLLPSLPRMKLPQSGFSLYFKHALRNQQISGRATTSARIDRNTSFSFHIHGSSSTKRPILESVFEYSLVS
jgi:hypothetical protein